jgi:hypothetical protein
MAKRRAAAWPSGALLYNELAWPNGAPNQGKIEYTLETK